MGNGDLIASSIMDRIYKYYSETDVEENLFKNNSISLSPNPATDFIEISVPENDHTLKSAVEGVRIFNVFGEEVTTTPPFGHPFELEGEALRIDVSALPPGVYFVRVGEKVGKFVKT